MPKKIIEIDNISKCYHIGAQREPYLLLRDKIARYFSLARRREQFEQTRLWALKDVSFNVEEGDVVGIIGRNGAGKSTLLKIISRITPPNSGRIIMRGSIASLLEVGTGFHLELTGRENVFLRGAILGMSHKEIASQFDQIVAFSEVEKFLDTPVKHYSSGMYLRLAFSIAAHLNSEILLIDEVLSVGDAQFQQKCFKKMNEISQDGRTVIFITHNILALQKLCNKGILLNQGRVAFSGNIEEVANNYLQSLPAEGSSAEFNTEVTAGQKGIIARLLKVELLNGEGKACDAFFVGDVMSVKITAMFYKKFDSAQLSFTVRSPIAGNIYHCLTRDANFLLKDLQGRVVITATFPRISLYPGTYIIDDLWLASLESLEALDCEKDAVAFRVIEGGNYLSRSVGKNKALVHEIPVWRMLKEN